MNRLKGCGRRYGRGGGAGVFLGMVAATGAVASPAALAAAAGKSFALDWTAVDGGGGAAVASRFRLAAGSIGQSAAAKVAAGKLAAVESGVPVFATDSDSDGIDDTVEAVLGTSPVDPDTDADGLDDFAELKRDGDPDTYLEGLDTDPLDEDTDDDGLLDGEDPNPLMPASRARVPTLSRAATFTLLLALVATAAARRRPQSPEDGGFRCKDSNR